MELSVMIRVGMQLSMELIRQIHLYDAQNSQEVLDVIPQDNSDHIVVQNLSHQLESLPLYLQIS